MGTRYLIDSNILIQFQAMTLPENGQGFVANATSLINNLTLITGNTKDFENMTGLKVINPWNL